MPALTALPATLSPRRLSLSLSPDKAEMKRRASKRRGVRLEAALTLTPTRFWLEVTGEDSRHGRSNAAGTQQTRSWICNMRKWAASPAAANCKGHVELFKKMRCDSHRSWETLPHCTHTQIIIVLNGKLFKNCIFSLLLNIQAPEWGCCISTFRRGASVWHHKGLYREDRDAILVRKFCITWDL